MSGCDYLQRDGAPALEDCASDPHVAGCEDCRLLLATHERLLAALPAAAARHQPPPGWQAAVRGRIAERGRGPRARRVMLPAGLAAAAAVAALALWLQPRPGDDGRFRVSVTAPAGAIRSGGAEAAPGSTLLLDAPTGAGFVELRVYRDDTVLALRCSSQPPCRREGARLRAHLTLSAIGTYQPVVVRSEKQIPDPLATLDKDAEAALQAGARVELGRPVHVR